MYKIYEALSKLNASYNACVEKNEIINTFYYKDSVYGRYGHKIYDPPNVDELGFLGDTHCFYYRDDYLDNAYFSIIKIIDDIMKKTYNQENFEKMFYAINNREQVKRFWGDRYNGVFRYEYDFNAIIDDDIEDKEEKEEEKIQFNLKIASAKVTKSKSEVSGDTSIQTKLHDGKFMMAISDGMGSRTKS